MQQFNRSFKHCFKKQTTKNLHRDPVTASTDYINNNLNLNYLSGRGKKCICWIKKEKKTDITIILNICMSHFNLFSFCMVKSWRKVLSL